MSHLAKDPNPISLRCLNTNSVMLWKSLNPSEQLWQFHETQGIIYNIRVSEITMATALLHSSVLNKVGLSCLLSVPLAPLFTGPL